MFAPHPASRKVSLVTIDLLNEAIESVGGPPNLLTACEQASIEIAQEDVIQAGQVVLEQLGLKISDRKKPEIASLQVITNVNPYQAQLLNRLARGMMLVPGQTMLVLECAPAAYINLAANEAEKAAPVNLMHISSVGRFGRLWMAGTEADILAARDAAVTALNEIEGVP